MQSHTGRQISLCCATSIEFILPAYVSFTPAMRASGEEALRLYQYQPSVGLEKLKGCPVLDESSARLAGLRTIWVAILLQLSRLLSADPVR